MKTENVVLAHQDIPAEQMVISALLQDQDSILQLMDIAVPEDFYWEKHRLIVDACLSLYKEGGDIDPVTVRNKLKSQGADERIGGINYLWECLDIMPTSVNIKVHARLVKEASLMRKIDAWLYAKRQGMHNGYKANQILLQMQQELTALSELVVAGKDPYCKSIMKSIFRGWELLKEGKIPFIKTAAKIGEVIPAFFPGHLWMIGGYTSTGKSTFLAQLIVDIGEADGRVLVFSTEDSQEEKMKSLISNVADVPKKALIMGDFNQDQMPAVINAMSHINEKFQPIIYDDVFTAAEIRLKAKRHKLKDNIKVICIDYVQNLRGEGSLYDRMSSAAEQLFSLGRELGVTVVVLSQVNNDSVRDDSPVIGLKGAGELSAAADIILWLKRSQMRNEERYLDVEIRKNRPFGITGILKMSFSLLYTRIDRRAL